eukprot:TRINITY_DN10075_c2_g1_i1.p1 TRINITY_DN10075_c2_g1~~TRINITY_DN10075_c2_g1_i1.p1  ORF type:complete len:521 (-),score=51.47 TRINITY_DN10075_c2_g1_i1:158-1720(-)
MIDYRAGTWGFHVAWGWKGSVAPRALVMAIPNAVITFILATWWLQGPGHDDLVVTESIDEKTADAARSVIAAFTSVMVFILYNRSNTAYDRWWEGGTLLQQTRGEWFNAYSSIMAFTSTKPEMKEQVDEYTQLLARMMSLLMCCGLQQVSPDRARPFAVLDLEGLDDEAVEFLNSAPDKVEVILQWIQRSMVLHAHTGVLPVPPPILSRAFQEISRGIVNLQNARKIADFPYPFPLAQISMVLQLLHYAMTPILAAMGLPRIWAVAFTFSSIFVLWCIHFNALDLEWPFGSRDTDLPMNDFQRDWNESVMTLLDKRGSTPPVFAYDAKVHPEITLSMSDGGECPDVCVCSAPAIDRGSSVISLNRGGRKKPSPFFQKLKASQRKLQEARYRSSDHKDKIIEKLTTADPGSIQIAVPSNDCMPSNGHTLATVSATSDKAGGMPARSSKLLSSSGRPGGPDQNCVRQDKDTGALKLEASISHRTPSNTHLQSSSFSSGNATTRPGKDASSRCVGNIYGVFYK